MQKEIPIEGDSQERKGTLITPDEGEGPYAGFLCIHGLGSDRKRYVRLGNRLKYLNIASLAFDLSGYGQDNRDPQKFSRKDHLDDILNAYETLVTQPDIDSTRTGIIASSYGAYLAAIATSRIAEEGKHQIRWLALRAPALATDDGFEQPTLKLLQEGNVTDPKNWTLDRCSPLRAARDFGGQLLIVGSAADEVIPLEAIQEYNTAANRDNLTFRFIIFAKHELTDEQWNEGFSHIIYGWLEKRLG